MAVIAMMAAHTARLIPFADRPAWARAVLLYEPAIPSLFLFLVGLSMSMSRRAARARSSESTGAWYARQARRAAGLWAISVLFFVAEYGVRLPDALLSGGILAVIAYSILLVGALLLFPRAASSAALSIALVAGTFVFWKLDAHGHVVYPLTSGSAPILPMALFAIAGACVGEAWTNTRRGDAVKWIAGGLGAAVAVWLVHRFGVQTLFTKPFGRGDAGRTLAAPLLTRGDALHVGFYDLRPVLAVACLGLHLAALGVLGAALRNLREKAVRGLFALGRHALGAYVLHLAILAVIVTLFDRHPLTAVTGTVTWVALILICQTGSILLGAKKRV